eukprot:5717143-Pleurochrysis_carterae.AAC.1
MFDEASLAATARSLLIPSLIKLTVTGNGCDLRFSRVSRSGLLIERKAAVVYSRRASTCAFESLAVAEKRWRTKSSRVSPLRPMSRWRPSCERHGEREESRRV